MEVIVDLDVSSKRSNADAKKLRIPQNRMNANATRNSTDTKKPRNWQ